MPPQSPSIEMYYGNERERERISLIGLRFNSCLFDLLKGISLNCSNDITANLFLVYNYFSCVTEKSTAMMSKFNHVLKIMWKC